ncbi:Di-copper centre-containing protein [Aureobasidium pullulans]|nr:Di-copper centre-containing protein [Aureobasidium pullulans]
MSEQTIYSEKQQLAMDLEKKQPHNNDLESQDLATPPPARPVFLVLWLLFVFGTVATIVSSNWNKPESRVHGQNILQKPTSVIATSTSLPTSAPTSTCNNLTLRREWRSMKPREQRRYQTAMRCLLELPSKNDRTGSRLGDFLSAYSTSGWHATQTSDYLPWNRFFMHTLESALRNECAYRGDMPYLDWTAVPATTAESSDATSTTAQSSQAAIRDEAAKQHLDAALVSEIMSAVDYDDFVHVLEARITDLAPFDFSTPELPQDPLFLHQMQVDRLWWLWQQQHSKAEMPVEDERVRIRGFGNSVAVKSVATTEGYDLCYRYV